MHNWTPGSDIQNAAHAFSYLAKTGTAKKGTHTEGEVSISFPVKLPIQEGGWFNLTYKPGGDCKMRLVIDFGSDLRCYMFLNIVNSVPRVLAYYVDIDSDPGKFGTAELPILDRQIYREATIEELEFFMYCWKQL